AGFLPGSLNASPTWAKLVDGISAVPNRLSASAKLFKVCLVIKRSLIASLNFESSPSRTPGLMGKYHPPASRSAQSNPVEDEVLLAPPALGPASVRKAGSCRSPPPRHPPAGSCLAARR